MNHKVIGNVFCVLNPIELRGIIERWPTDSFYTEQKILTLFEIRIHNICYRVGKKTISVTGHQLRRAPIKPHQ